MATQEQEHEFKDRIKAISLSELKRERLRGDFGEPDRWQRQLVDLHIQNVEAEEERALRGRQLTAQENANAIAERDSGTLEDANRIAGDATKYARDSRSIALGAFVLSVIALLIALLRG